MDSIKCPHFSSLTREKVALMTTSREVEVGATLHAALDMSLVMSPQHFLAAARSFQHMGAAELGHHQQQKA